MDSLTRKLLFRSDNAANLALSRSINAEHERILIRWARQYKFQALFPPDASGKCTCKAGCPPSPSHPVPGVKTSSSADMRNLLLAAPGLEFAFVMKDGSLQPVDFNDMPFLAPSKQEIMFGRR